MGTQTYGTDLEVGKLYQVKGKFAKHSYAKDFLPNGWYSVAPDRDKIVGFLVLKQIFIDNTYFQEILLTDRVCMACIHPTFVWEVK